MKTYNMILRVSHIWMLSFALCVGLVQPMALGDLIVNPPPDADKAFLAGNDSCGLATAANLLAAAGYGTGLTMQDQADDIYGDMIAQYGTGSAQWPDTCLTWWINSAHNTNPSNPYKNIQVSGNKIQSPWLNPNAPRTIGNDLRDWEFVGVVIYNANFHHAITAWGDEATLGQLTNNPAQIWVTDSDTDAGGDVQHHTYDAYSAIAGWRFNGGYANPHVTLENATSLRSVDIVTDHTNTQVIVGSYQIHQNDSQKSATDLHYVVGTDVDILSYRTEIDWPRPNNPAPPDIVTDNPRRNLTVDWDMSEDPVPYCNWVTITTSLVVPTWNTVEYSNVHWTYPPGGDVVFPGFKWEIQTPMYIEPNEVVENITGGYVIGSFDVFTDPLGSNMVGRFRGQHEYDYFQDPEEHHFELTSLEDGVYYVGNIRFGHSYGLLDEDSLWDFEEWMSEFPAIQEFIPGMPISILLDWDGLLPYPEAPGPMPVLARNPYPTDGSYYDDTWVNLSWTPGPFAASHDVYLGENFDTVNEGSEETFVGNQTTTFLIAGFPGFPYPDGLVQGTTYYWRVDEVESDGITTYKGDVWSFTVGSEGPSPFFSVSTLGDWDSLLNRPEGEYPRIDPVPADVFEEMVGSSNEWLPEYQGAVFTTPELGVREHIDGSWRLEPALYMRWGPEDTAVETGQRYAAAWDYDYGRATDFRDVELEFFVHAPVESTRVSINLLNEDGNWREFIWHVGGPDEIPACEWTAVRINPSTGQSNYPLELPAFEVEGFELSRIRMIRFDENGVWSEALPFPLDNGWLWNVWARIEVRPAPREGLMAAFAFGSRLLDCATYNDPSVNYTIVHQASPEAVQYDPARGYGYEVLYPTESPYGDRGGYGVFGPFDDSPNNRNEFPDECPEELYDSFIGAKDFLDECSEAVTGDLNTPCDPPEGIIFRVDVPNGLYRFVAAVGDADNGHAHRIVAEDGGSGPPENIGANHVVLVSNHDQSQYDIGEIEGDEPGDAVYARVGFDGKIPPPGDGVVPSPVFVDMDENGLPTDAGASSPVLEVTQGYIRIHQLQGNSNDSPSNTRDANGGDMVILELWKIEPEEADNLLANGGFEDGVMDPWSTYGSLVTTAEVVQVLDGAAVPEDPIEGNYCLHVAVADAGANFWDAGLQHDGHVFEAGKEYTLSVYLKSKSGTLDINLKPERGESPWEGYGEQIVTITEEWAEYSVTTPVLDADVDPASITFHIAFTAGDFWVDGASWTEVQ